MIKNFEDITSPMNNHEKEVILPAMLAILRNHYGIANKITSGQIIDACGHEVFPCSRKQGEIRVRRVVNYIRRHGLLPTLIATNNGYYLATEPKQVTDWFQGIKERARNMLHAGLEVMRNSTAYFGEEKMAAATEETKREVQEQREKYVLRLERKLEQKKEIKREKKKKVKKGLKLKPKSKFFAK